MAHNRTDLRHRRNSRSLTPNCDSYEAGKCKNKHRQTRERAQREAKRMEARTGQKMRAYRCRYGDHYHIGRERERLANGLVVIKKAGE